MPQMTVAPITPDQVIEKRRAGIPPQVFEAFNEPGRYTSLTWLGSCARFRGWNTSLVRWHLQPQQHLTTVPTYLGSLGRLVSWGRS